VPRQSKPYYRKSRGTWICTINGKRITLGKTKTEAFKHFYALMANKKAVATENFTLDSLSQSYLDWVKKHREHATYYRNLRYLKSLIEHVGKRLKPTNLTPAIVKKWVASHDTWGSTSQSDAIGVAQRLLNWAVEEEHIETNSIRGMKKPRRKRRDIVYTPDQWTAIRKQTNGSLLDLLDFLWSTGCRPKEARTLEACHIHGETVIFPGDESKGEFARVIFLIPEMKKLLDRNMKKHGPLFLNSHGTPWKKDAIVRRLRRISQKVGFRVIAYGARHSFATNALINEVDPISVAHLMGHKSQKMVAEVYSHLATNPAFLRTQALKSVGKKTV
jgi:integrase